ncbi:hypothetical protein GCM10009844_23840 [Nocardioides koreensis]|uniref:UvrD-like helicase C-terminal domain-containing protein n=1 Tax=Nocardioides koreensis TaxID=433651 RepID=A0ABN2ZT08_9ACTN
MSDSTVRLDAEQEQAASISPDVRQIVLAPPGSGKTEVVAALLQSLADQGLDAYDEILAISFSRAAVGALRRRAGQGDAPAPAIRTLDGLAARLLDELADEEWRALSFDKRIKRALELVEEGGESIDLDMLRHLIVDEVQDLVGIRARLVWAILERLPGEVGFTLLGDPEQAVYDFQLENEKDLTSGQFLDRVRGLGGVQDIRLQHQYRARTEEAGAAATLLASRPCGEERTRVVRSFLSQVFMAGDVADVGRAARRWKGSTAFLCRTNGQALMVSASLRDAGCPVGMRSQAEELPVAAWIAETVHGSAGTTMRRTDVESRLAGLAPMGAEEAWRLLKEAEGDFRLHDRIDLRRLRNAVARRNLPAELLDGAAAGQVMLVSTIHRAKGLEFDNVVLINPSDLLPADADQEDVSVAYVAATRPRVQLVAARCQLPRHLRLDNRTGRWYIGGYEKWRTRAFEVRGIDTSDAVDIEHGFSASSLPVGAEVSAVVDPRRSDFEFPIYSLQYGGHEVARTSEAFGRTLARRIGGYAGKRKVPWPGLSGLALEAVETRAGEGISIEDPLLSLGVRVGGMATLDWGGNGAA